MALTEEISVKLGISTAEFKAALKDAGATVDSFKKTGETTEDEGLRGTLKNIKKEMKEFRELLVAGGMIEAVRRFFDFAIDAANKSKDTNNENVKAVREFGKALEEVKPAVGSVATALLGFFNQAGEGWGMIINRLRGVTAEQERLYEQTQKDLDAQTENIKKTNEIAKIKRDSAFQEADLLEKAKILLHDNLALEAQIQKVKLDSVEYAKLEAQIKKNNLDAGKLIADQEKQTAELRQKTAEAAQKAAAEEAKYKAEGLKLDTELAKIAYDKLTPEQKIVELKKQQAAIQYDLLDGDQDENGVKRDLIDLEKNVAEVEKLRSSILRTEIVPAEEKVTKEKKEQLVTSQATLDIASRMIAMYGFTIDSDPAKQQINEQAQRQSANESTQREINALEAEINKYQQSGAKTAQYLIQQDRAKEDALRQRLNNDNYIFDPNYTDSIGKGIAATSFHAKDVDAASLNQKTLTSINDNISNLNAHVTAAFPLT